MTSLSLKIWFEISKQSSYDEQLPKIIWSYFPSNPDTRKHQGKSYTTTRFTDETLSVQKAYNYRYWSFGIPIAIDSKEKLFVP